MLLVVGIITTTELSELMTLEEESFVTELVELLLFVELELLIIAANEFVLSVPFLSSILVTSHPNIPRSTKGISISFRFIVLPFKIKFSNITQLILIC